MRCRKLPCRVSGVVSSARARTHTHARTRARTHTHTRTRTRTRTHTHTHAHASTHAHGARWPILAAECTRAGRTAALGFDPQAAHLCARTGLTPTHIRTRSQRCHGRFVLCCAGVRRRTRCACAGAPPPAPPSRCRTSAPHRCVCVEYPRRGEHCAIIESSPRTNRHADRPACM